MAPQPSVYFQHLVRIPGLFQPKKASVQSESQRIMEMILGYGMASLGKFKEQKLDELGFILR